LGTKFKKREKNSSIQPWVTPKNVRAGVWKKVVDKFLGLFIMIFTGLELWLLV
jgi:hypothetical protein